MLSQEASKVTAIKDQTVGAIKETIGNMIGNNKMELEGKAQKVHGKNEYDYAKASKTGEEPEKFKQAYVSHADHAELSSDPTQHEHSHLPAQDHPEPSQMSGIQNQALGSIKQNLGSATNNPEMEIAGKAQNIHGHNEAEFAKANKAGHAEPSHFEQGKKDEHKAQGSVEGQSVSNVSALKDQAMGAVKEKIGSATNNHEMELIGKSQSVHGRNEAEFAKAQKQGHPEPEHFGQGTKTTDHASGSIEGQNASTFSSMKDQALGSVKQSYGSATGDLNTELAGKAQQIHGKNEAEFAKAQKDGYSEPQHFQHGKKTTDHAEGKVEEDKPSKMSGYKDQAVGSVKQTLASATGNQQMELEGMAQKIKGSNQCSLADEKNSINA